MRKFMVAAIPVATLIIFVLVMLSGNFLKKPLSGDDDVPGSIEKAIRSVNNGNWEEAGTAAEQLQRAWDKVVSRVQFSSERDEINALSMNLARLQGAIIAKDKSDALMELKEAYEHWEELGN